MQAHLCPDPISHIYTPGFFHLHFDDFWWKLVRFESIIYQFINEKPKLSIIYYLFRRVNWYCPYCCFRAFSVPSFLKILKKTGKNRVYNLSDFIMKNQTFSIIYSAKCQFGRTDIIHYVDFAFFDILIEMSNNYEMDKKWPNTMWSASSKPPHVVSLSL